MRPLPKEGQIVYIHGYEFIVRNLSVVDNPNTPGGGKVCRFTGICTAHERNDSIRHTGYNGGHYGWKVYADLEAQTR